MKVQCKLCGRWLYRIGWGHLNSRHKISVQEYIGKFSDADLYSSEFINGQSEKTINWWSKPENRAKGVATNRKRWDSEEQRKLAAEKTEKYMKENPQVRVREGNRLKAMNMIRWANPEKHEEHARWAREYWNSGTEEEREKRISKFFAGLSTRPTEPEILVGKILQDNFPNEFVYNGDFSRKIVIAGLIPDYVNVNGRKQIIEVFGEIFHEPEKYLKIMKRPIKWHGTELGRIMAYNSVGWDCLVIWADDLKNLDRVTGRIGEFVNLQRKVKV